MGERSGDPSGFSPASIVISKPPVAVQLPQPDVSPNHDAPQSVAGFLLECVAGFVGIRTQRTRGRNSSLERQYPGVDFWSQDGGHLLKMMFFERGVCPI
jgi:hypothetical protein